MPHETYIIHKRYAKALLLLAEENNILERSYEDLRRVYSVFNQNKELGRLMKSPVIRLNRKQNIISRLFGTSVHPLILGYMKIIIRKQRGYMLEGIALEYLTVYKQYLGIECIKVITAVPMDSRLRMQAMAMARRLTDKEIEFEETVDESILGGVILRIGEKQYNSSVKLRLSMMKKHLNK